MLSWNIKNNVENNGPQTLQPISLLLVAYG